MSCSYKVGKLKNFIYLIKDLKYRVVDYKVYITSGEVYKLDANLVTFTETESYAGRFKFTTTVTATLNRIYNDSRIRQNNYKVVVEDTKGQQYIVSPEFDAHLLESTQLIMKELLMLSLLLHRVIYLQEYCSLK